MAVPSSPTARLFYRAAFDRLEEADVLGTAGYPTGAVYLGGYAVECGLKALVLSSVPASRQAAVEATFRGVRGHDLRWLRREYLRLGGAKPPTQTEADLDEVGTWTTGLRYSPGRVDEGTAKRFLAASRRLLEWADRRLI